MRYLVNDRQPPEERREKYNLIRELGLSVSHAKRYRDWRWSKINRFMEANGYGNTYSSRTEYIKAKAKEELEQCNLNS
jgi:hypothetical protein